MPSSFFALAAEEAAALAAAADDDDELLLWCLLPTTPPTTAATMTTTRTGMPILSQLLMPPFLAGSPVMKPVDSFLPPDPAGDRPWP